jgi:hypothetical protein
VSGYDQISGYALNPWQAIYLGKSVSNGVANHAPDRPLQPVGSLQFTDPLKESP